MPNGFSSSSTNSTYTPIENLTTGYITASGDLGQYLQEITVSKIKSRISPQLYFKFVKNNLKKLPYLSQFKFNSRIKKIESAFEKAAKAGMVSLSEKLIATLIIETRESAIYARGVKMFVEKGVLNKYKQSLNNGHISDTLFEKYTRVIPDDVLEKKKKTEGVFDSYVIYHYFNEKQDDVSKMSNDEKNAMRDPILFGRIKETDKLYFIADWEDEYCTLTFSELADVMGDDNIGEITGSPSIQF